MPRPKTKTDEQVLEAALTVMHERGPQALTFASLAKQSGLSAATLVQRFGDKFALKQRALLHAWDRLDASTARLDASVPKTPAGAVDLLVGLSAQYGEIETYAEGLLVLREDLRDPVVRARGAAWKAALTRALDKCFATTPGAPDGLGLMTASQWQGVVLWWSFDPQANVEDVVQESLRRFLSAVVTAET